MNATKSGKRNRFALLGIAALLLIAPLVISDPYLQHVLIVTLLAIIMALSVRLIFASGLVTMCQAAFVTIGGYSSALLVKNAGLNFWLALPLSGVVAMAIATAIGIVVLRLRSFYFIVVTIGFQALTMTVIQNWTNLTGGFAGVPGIPSPNAILLPLLDPIKFDSKLPYYYLALGLTLIATAVMLRIEKSRLGRFLWSIHQNELLARSVGVDAMRYRLSAFAVASFFAGTVGSFSAHYVNFIGVEVYTVWDSILYLIFGLVGGMGSFAGPIVGAVALTALPEILRAFQTYKGIAFAIVLMVTIFYLPDGLVSVPRLVRARFQKSATQ